MPQLSYAPTYLVPQHVERSDGVGPAIDLGPLSGKLLVVTLRISEVLEQENLAVSIWGSALGTDWGSRPLLSFPQKSYCGVYATILNLANHSTIRFLRVEWTMNRLAQRNSGPMFGFSVCLEDSLCRVSTQVA